MRYAILKEGVILSYYPTWEAANQEVYTLLEAQARKGMAGGLSICHITHSFYRAAEKCPPEAVRHSTKEKTMVISDEEANARLEQKTAPRVTKEDIERRIARHEFTRLSGTVTLCTVTLDNGYSVYGESACVSPENYDQQLGEKYAYEAAFRKLWPLFGFLLAETLFVEQGGKYQAKLATQD